MPALPRARNWSFFCALRRRWPSWHFTQRGPADFGTALILEFCHDNALTSYHGLFSLAGFKRAAILEGGAYSFILAVGSAVMFAGSAALAPNEGLAEVYRLATGGVLLLFVLISGRKGVLAVGGRWLAPFITAFLLLLALGRIGRRPELALQNGQGGPWQGVEAALLYASYNLGGFSVAVLTGTAGLLKKKSQRLTLAVLANLLLGGVILLLFGHCTPCPPGPAR